MLFQSPFEKDPELSQIQENPPKNDMERNKISWNFKKKNENIPRNAKWGK